MSVQNIIVRMPNWLGDAIMATPLLADLRYHWPTATITAMCQCTAHEERKCGTLCPISSLLIGNPHVDEIFSFSRPNEFLRRQQARDLIGRLRLGKYDLGILLPNSFSSAWWFWQGHVRERIGFATDWRNFLLTTPLPLPADRERQHLIETYRALLQPLGILTSTHPPALYVLPEERKAATELIRQQRIPEGATLIGINPGAAYGSAKCWLPERFRELITQLIRRPQTYVICFADKTGTSLANAICGGFPPQVINLAAETNIRELISLIEQCTLFVTNDSGPMHIAAALRTPLVALFGSTNPQTTGPYQHGQVIHKQVSCSPCYLRTCPIDFRCMKEISVEEVYQTIMTQLPPA